MSDAPIDALEDPCRNFDFELAAFCRALAFAPTSRVIVLALTRDGLEAVANADYDPEDMNTWLPAAVVEARMEALHEAVLHELDLRIPSRADLPAEPLDPTSDLPAEDDV